MANDTSNRKRQCLEANHNVNTFQVYFCKEAKIIGVEKQDVEGTLNKNVKLIKMKQKSMQGRIGEFICSLQT